MRTLIICVSHGIIICQNLTIGQAKPPFIPHLSEGDFPAGMLNQLLPFEAGLAVLLQAVRILSAMAVEVRYPGMAADEDDAAEALRSSKKIRDAIRTTLSI